MNGNSVLVGQSLRLRISPEQIAACSFDRWYSRFRTSNNDKQTFLSRFVQLDERFVNYLKQDGILLPKPPREIALLKARDPRKTCAMANDDDDSWADEDDEEDEDAEEPFVELEAQIEDAIVALGSEVFPKLNWSSPRDAAWMGGGTLACATPGEVFVLLKSSDFCHSDLRTAESVSIQPVLALRKYLQLNPSLEFRCFVRNEKLAYACQRDPSRYHAFLNEGSMKRKIMDSLTKFIEDIVVTRFDAAGASGFIADVYIEMSARRPNGKCWLVDIAPLPEKVESVDLEEAGAVQSNELLATPPHPLLDWETLFDARQEDLGSKLLIVTDRNMTDVSEQKVLAMHRVPLDLVHGALTNETFENGFNRLRESMHRPGNSQDDVDAESE